MADTLIGSAVSISDLNDMCPRAKQYALGTAVNAALAQLGIAASDTTIAIGDGTDAVVIGESDATGTPTITINGDTDACTVNIATAANHTTNIGTGTGATNLGGTASGAVTIRSNGAIIVGNTEANSLTLSGGAGLASLDGTTVAVGPATTSTVDIGSATAGAVTMKSNSTITVGNAEANSLTLSGGAGLASLDGTTVAVGPATTSTIAVGSAVAGAITVSSNSTITVGNAEANSLTLSGGAGLASLDGTTVAVGPATTSTVAIGSTLAGAVSILSGSTITIGDTTTTDSITMISAGAVDIGKAGQATTIKGTLNVDQAASFDTTVQIGATALGGLAIGGGSSTTKLTTAAADTKFGAFWTESTDATGADSRGIYWRHYLAGAGGAQSGEAARLYTTVSASAANAARGAHISLDFGTSGDVSGLGAAVDATLHVPDGNLGGTVAAVSADIHGDGASSDITGTGSFFRASLQGTTTNLQDVFLLNIEGTGSAAAYNSGEMYVLTNSGTITEALMIKTPAGTRYIPLLSATVAP